MRQEWCFHLILLAFLLSSPLGAKSAESWPAETNTSAVALSGIDTGLNTVNWSGAFWNPETRLLWLSCNSGWFWALEEDGAGGWQVATNASGTEYKWTPYGDLEDICQADFSSNIVFLMDENGYIKEYDVSQPDTLTLNRSWNIQAVCPEVSGLFGGEGIAFVPNEYLARQGFCDSNGVPILATNGMGGLMLVGYQNDGAVYAFDLDRTLNTYTLVGIYQTGWAETADLSFDRTTGQLYVWHNPGNVDTWLEVTELRSEPDGTDRRLNQIVVYSGPRNGNLEAFERVPSAETNDSGGCIVTDDDNLNSESVMWYRQYAVEPDTDGDGLSDAMELWHFGSVTQTTGSADSDGDGMSNADEETAGTDPTNSASLFIWEAPQASSREFVLSWPSATGRTYGIRKAVMLEFTYTNPVLSGIPATPPMNVCTLNTQSVTGNNYYQLYVEP